MRNQRIFSALAVIILSYLAPIASLANGNFYISGDAGASFATVGNADPTITYYNNLLTDGYPLNDDTAAAATLGLNGGYEWQGSGWKPSMSLGLGLYGTPDSYNYNGQVNETALGGPTDTLYNNTFDIYNLRLIVDSKFT